VSVKRSAGLLLYRSFPGDLEVLLGHMGGPLWARRDDAGWSIPKGEYEPDEPARSAAYREFVEELGLPVPSGELLDLGELRQPSGKIITVWGLGADLDLRGFDPGTFEMEWPRGSGRVQRYPEIDRAAWLDIATARRKLVSGQRPFLDRLLEKLG
jgi:predicted NUDIX family NTP pyrophosphohydrolase